MVLSLHSPAVFAADQFRAYACLVLGVLPRCSSLATSGRSTYCISYRAIGQTKVVARVKYVSPTGEVRTQEFNGSITFTTGDAVGQPTVQFRGVPFGTAVRVTVE